MTELVGKGHNDSLKMANQKQIFSNGNTNM